MENSFEKFKEYFEKYGKILGNEFKFDNINEIEKYLKIFDDANFNGKGNYLYSIWIRKLNRTKHNLYKNILNQYLKYGVVPPFIISQKKYSKLTIGKKIEIIESLSKKIESSLESRI